MGTDLELFMKDSTTEEFISAIPFIKREMDGIIYGTKDKPLLIEGFEEYGNVQYDTVLFEIAVEKSDSPEGLVNNMYKMFKAIPVVAGHKAEVAAVPSTVMPESQMTDEESWILGCSPDHNAWTLMQNIPPNVVSTRNRLRSAGMHIHVSPASKETEFLVNSEKTAGGIGSIVTVRYFDLVLGALSVLFDNSAESKMRRTLYGKAGAYRLKEYGFEYRSLSNSFVADPEIATIVFSAAADTVSYIANCISKENIDVNSADFCEQFELCDKVPGILSVYTGEYVQSMVNDMDEKKAEYIKEHVFEEILSESTINMIRNYKPKHTSFSNAWGIGE
jgi:hypothetical protein